MVDTTEQPAPPPVRPSGPGLVDATGVLPPHAYTDEAVFRDEMTRIFRRSWLFVGFTDDLAAENDYITAELAGTSVVVQNFGGQLRAFHNICSHRFSRIQDGSCGNRRLQCPYHGWLYNRDGVPVGIPGNEAFFGLDRQARQARALQRFEVGVRGRFVFVRLELGGSGLDEHLGACGAMLDHASALFPDRFEDRTAVWEADWKVGVESVLEVYHVDSVHPETFQPFFGKVWDIRTEGLHSSGRTVLSPAGERYWDGIVRHLGLVGSDRYSGYENHLIFPNLAVGITHGAMMSVQTYDPVAPGRCSLRFHLFMAATRREDRRTGPVRTHVEESLRVINLKVLEEDRAISESVQQGLRQARWPALPGRNEERIRAFHRGCFGRIVGREE
ncbi:aromatic ring-hydroxylating oxygenase subunit alpha [Azospirillum agricola]|uniref:aromatic ring-hydroxylating oxygenase subunit alpha n=1 Tax=Azospirillum agricola TaxID=1720247 RepID=UPI000A0F3597|nr:SRPBCC family protein [Azospirillum agricola]SMH41629.1 Phenylpropionate dioxygenase, large terminal subunit [Azospirillum lipoferum]